MLLLWILCVIFVIVFLRYLYLILKRCNLLRKICKNVKKHNGTMQYCRNPFISIFRHDTKTDISLSLQDKVIEVSIMTTPLRRVRYHFDISNKFLELIIERKAVVVGTPNAPKPSYISALDRVYTIRKYKIGLEKPNNENQKYVILNPAPRSVSKADGATLIALFNNDELISGVKVCGLKWFVENIFNE